MSTKLISRQALAVLALLATTVLIFTTVRWPRVTARAEATDVLPTTGVGETLLLVVAGVRPIGTADGFQDSVNSRLGHVQGFYVARTDSYHVKNVLEPAGATVTRVTCPRPGATASIDLGVVECPEAAKHVDVLRPIRLRVADGDAASREPFASVLDASGAFPSRQALIATAFRTKTGAQEFLELARAVGIRGLVTVQAIKIGGGDIGLGQEPHPDGSGPLLGPLPDQERFQR